MNINRGNSGKELVQWLGLALALLAGTASPAQAQYWLPTTPDNWSVGTDWYGGNVPTAGSPATINNGGTVTIDDSTGIANCSTLFVGNGTANGGPGINGAVNMTGGTLIVTNSVADMDEKIGDVVSSSGFFSQSGGLNGTTGMFLYLGYGHGGVGSYQLSGGQLTAAVEYLSYAGNGGAVSTGTFLQTGGTNGDAKKPVAIYVGGMGMNGASKNYGIQGQGSYTLDGGLIRGGQVSVGGQTTGTFTQNGGTLATIGGGDVEGSANYNNKDGDLMLGVWTGTLGNGNGTYTLNGGLIDTTNVSPGNGGYEYIGLKSTGTFIQTGGTNHVAQSLYLVGMSGEFADPNLAGMGSYTLSNTGLLTVNGSENIGNMDQSMGTATFTQSGGTNTCSSITVAAGFGTYNLNGGLLNGVTSFSGPLNFTGGTLQASSGTVQMTGPTTVGTAASNVATADARGNTMFFNFGDANAAPISGPGSLTVIDSLGGGTVVLGGMMNITDSTGQTIGIGPAPDPTTNTYTGGTTVVSGTLQVLNAQALPNTGVLTVAGPGSLVSLASVGTLFENNAVGQAAALETSARSSQVSAQ